MKALENDELSEEIQLKINNAFINSPFKYTQIELDVIFMLLLVWSEGENTYTFRLSQLANITGRRYRQPELIKEIQRLMANVYTVTLQTPPPEPELSELLNDDVDVHNDTYEAFDDDEDDISWISYVLFSSVKYHHGLVTAKLTDQAMALFADTKKNYTHLQLKSALLLTNKYSKRLYMLLSEWAFAGGKKYTLEALRKLLMPAEDCDNEEQLYKENYDFKVLIERAVGDINRITELHVENTFGKQQRSLVSVNFTINRENQQQLPLGESEINYNNSLEKNEFLGRCKHYGLTDNQAMEMWDKGCRLNNFVQIIKDVNRQCVKNPGSIKNIEGYIATCCANAGYLSIDKSDKDLNKARRNSKKKQQLEERERIVNMIRQALDGGADVSAFSSFIDAYQINADELQ